MRRGKLAFATFSITCSFVGFGPPYVLPLRYLWIFETEMAHVVVDETEGETSVHESQAPLGREREREWEQRYTCNSTLVKLMMLLSTSRPKCRFSDWFFQKCWFIKQNPNKMYLCLCLVECCGKSSKGRTTFGACRCEAPSSRRRDGNSDLNEISQA